MFFPSGEIWLLERTCSGTKAVFWCSHCKCYTSESSWGNQRQRGTISVCFTSAAASFVALSILMLPNPKAASFFMGCAKGGRTGTSGFIFFPTDTRSLASLSYQLSSHPLAHTWDLGKQGTPQEELVSSTARLLLLLLVFSNPLQLAAWMLTHKWHRYTEAVSLDCLSDHWAAYASHDLLPQCLWS